MRLAAIERRGKFGEILAQPLDGGASVRLRFYGELWGGAPGDFPLDRVANPRADGHAVSLGQLAHGLDRRRGNRTGRAGSGPVPAGGEVDRPAGSRLLGSS